MGEFSYPQEFLTGFPIIFIQKESNQFGKLQSSLKTAKNDQKTANTANELARKKFQEKLLQDIRVDLMICEIEGWDKLEYIQEIKNLINSIGAQTDEKI